ncbi:MAG: ABC transporter substrate-binding protein [Tepidisphaeraceae bacterium]
MSTLLLRFARPFSLGLLVVALAALLVGCGDSSQADNAHKKHVFRFINRGDLLTLDLNRMSYLQDFRITYAIREGLFGYDPNRDFSATPTLALRTDSPDGGRTYRFTLRPDGKWNNGDPVVADDFVFSWRLMLESPGEYTSLFYYIDNAEAYKNAIEEKKPMDFADVGIRAIDDHTLEMRLKKAMPQKFVEELLAFPPFYPRHRKSMEPFRNKEAGDRLAYYDRYTREQFVVTNGPFKLQTWRPGAKVVMVPNEFYWDRASVKLDEVVMVVVDDPNSAYTQFLQGKVHWLSDVDADIAFRRSARATPS